MEIKYLLTIFGLPLAVLASVGQAAAESETTLVAEASAIAESKTFKMTTRSKRRSVAE